MASTGQLCRNSRLFMLVLTYQTLRAHDKHGVPTSTSGCSVRPSVWGFPKFGVPLKGIIGVIEGLCRGYIGSRVSKNSGYLFFGGSL